ncbi:hypothetical protein BBO99_00003559 [Phytophthora kernoviae]|uniref:Crinkler effector protein N-terminal domain-containing protein n=2 Tax=Phytophthora kernoviae TaxID=325452 RepID=A0A3R7J1M4_9STRA|nr:hypothetical protein G195_007294 [Phytophthora kernoviae 00238/432]KAG2528520.1 hypothetical protein JM16_002743 [Phytophthora kernoviae]KAG2529156.1 hypothetical protein JM18_002917 [Phytophthora kernoviae]RLN06461.1 hypothetical protein BBI17_003663 [Phytophthora kernoviae]RLN81608.1 hypothetical protein BBO99_00003559 [Phytophthora kernoviae]
MKVDQDKRRQSQAVQAKQRRRAEIYALNALLRELQQEKIANFIAAQKQLEGGQVPKGCREEALTVEHVALAQIENGCTFTVGLDECETIGCLKEEIKNKMLYSFPADNLTLYLTKKNSEWLKSNDPDIKQLEEGEIPDGIKTLMVDDAKMDPSFRIATFGFLDEDDADSSDINVLVVVPAQHYRSPVQLWLVSGSIEKTLITGKVQERLNVLAGEYQAFYDFALHSNDIDLRSSDIDLRSNDIGKTIWNEDTTLQIHVLFKRGLHDWYDAVPLMNLHADFVSKSPVFGNRFEIKLVIRAINSSIGQVIAGRLKEDAVVSPDFLEMRTSVYMEDPEIFCECLAWKGEEIEKEWEYFVCKMPAVD